MIKYKLVCKDCNNIFDSWFYSSKEYEKLKKRKYLSCHICDSRKIEKALMAPNILNNSELKSKDINKIKEIKSKLREFKKFIKNNFKYVGENFAHEARSIHYDPKKKNKAIDPALIANIDFKKHEPKPDENKETIENYVKNIKSG